MTEVLQKLIDSTIDLLMYLYENINNKYKRKHKKIFLCFLIHLCVCLSVIFISFLTPLSNYTPSRQEQCFLQLQQLFEEISKLHNGNYNRSSASESGAQKCKRKWRT
jgi:quinol-cytochrome oxidoreductase complex cytochrome b subunit